MSRFRFSIGSFLGVVTLLALGLAALVSQSTLGASIAYTVFLSLLGLATTLAIVPGSRHRVFCTGFAVFGWFYWFTEFELPTDSVPQQLWTTGSSVGMPRPESFDDRPGPGLITRELITFVETNLSGNRQVGAQVMAEWTPGSYFPGTIVAAKGGQYQVQWVDGTQQWTPPHLIWSDPAGTKLACHSLIGGLFALLGPCSRRSLPVHQRRPSPQQPSREDPRHEPLSLFARQLSRRGHAAGAGAGGDGVAIAPGGQCGAHGVCRPALRGAWRARSCRTQSQPGVLDRLCDLRLDVLVRRVRHGQALPSQTAPRRLRSFFPDALCRPANSPQASG